MTEPAYDIVIRGGRVATASDVFDADVAIAGETVAAIGRSLPAGRREIDARGKLVLPGGVDSHAHIEQLSAAGVVNADTFESATTAAAFGGTTTVIPFAAQHVGMALPQVLADYHALAKKGAVIDYAFHMIIADPTEATLKDHIPKLVKAGHATIKVFMTYDDLVLNDPHLILPHPHLFERAFVLVPLAEIAPERVIAGVRLRAALEHLDRTGIEKLPPHG